MNSQKPSRHVQIIFNGQSREVPDHTSVAALLRELRLSDRPVAVEVNLQVVPRERHSGYELCDGDRLELVTLVGGG